MRRAMELLGGITTVAYYSSCILVFAFRLGGLPRVERGVGFAQMLFVVPLAALIAGAPPLQRPFLFYVQTALLLAFVLFEAVVDTILRVDFRSVRWAVVVYVVFFFAATGGMLGVASLSGRAWLILSVALFLVMAALAFIQRAATGR